MRRLILLSIAVLALSVLPASAGKTLPNSIPGWPPCDQMKPSSPSEIPPPHDPLVDAKLIFDKQALDEYGLNTIEDESYCRGSELLDATLFVMKDVSGAYGLYSYFRTPDMSQADFAEHSSMKNDLALVLVGNTVLFVRGRDLPAFESGIKSISAAVQLQTQEGLLPTLWEHLPQDNIVPRSDRYILGPHTLDQLFPGNLGGSLGFQNGAEAEVAHYRLNGQDAELLIADFPTPQLAQQQLASLQKKFNVNGSNPGAGSPLYAKRAITLLAIVAGAQTEADGGNLLSAVHSGTELTWNEPSFQFKEPRIEVMIVGSIIGSGVICLFAVIAGISFGGLRLIVKRVMPGKVFDRSEYVQILQLGLGSKPINSEDFYGYSAAPTEKVLVDKNLPDRVALRIFR